MTKPDTERKTFEKNAFYNNERERERQVRKRNMSFQRMKREQSREKTGMERKYWSEVALSTVQEDRANTRSTRKKGKFSSYAVYANYLGKNKVSKAHFYSLHL